MNVRMNLIQWTLVAVPFLVDAQSKQFVTTARSDDSARQSRTAEVIDRPTESASADATDVSITTLPLFGERPKTADQIDKEIHFLNDCDRSFSSRAEASDFFSARGWDYVANGQLDTAAYRFNLSWLLNDHNADAFWGLGVVCYQKNQLPDAIRMLKKGLAQADSNVVLMTDLATVEIKYFQTNATADALADAENHLQRAVAIGPASAAYYQKLSVVSFLKADYAKAWDYLHQARTLDISTLDLGYLSELLAKQTDPKGVFK